MTTNTLCRTDLFSKETQNSFSDSFGLILFKIFLIERHPKLVPNLYHGNQDVILTRRLGTKTPVVNTKWPLHFNMNPSVDPLITVYFSYLYVCRELCKRVLLQTF